MKPNDKVIEAALNTFHIVSRKVITDVLEAAYAAQFQSEEYADLIRSLRGEPPTNSTLDPLRAADAIEALLAERDALAARLAPVDDKVLVEIAAVAIRRNKFERTGRLDCFDPSNLTPEELGEGRAAIAAIRPHIEAAERERCAAALEITSDEIRLHAGEMSAQEMRSVLSVLAWRAAAIRRGK